MNNTVQHSIQFDPQNIIRNYTNGYRLIFKNKDFRNEFDKLKNIIDNQIHWADRDSILEASYRLKKLLSYEIAYAVREARLETLKYLIGLGADVEAEFDNKGCDRLMHLAARMGRQDILEILLEAGAQAFILNADGKHPHEVAFDNGHSQCGEFIHTSFTFRAERFLDAASRGDEQVLESMIKEGFELDLKIRGTFPLLMAAQHNHEQAVVCLLMAGADPNVMDGRNGRFPVHHAATFFKPLALNRLIANGADLDRQDSEGQTPLHLACSFGRLENTRILLEAGARMDIPNRDGQCPLNLIIFQQPQFKTLFERASLAQVGVTRIPEDGEVSPDSPETEYRQGYVL